MYQTATFETLERNPGKKPWNVDPEAELPAVQTIPQPWKETLERNPGTGENGENGEPF
jgi:hypothetical protein